MTDYKVERVKGEWVVFSITRFDHMTFKTRMGSVSTKKAADQLVEQLKGKKP